MERNVISAYDNCIVDFIKQALGQSHKTNVYFINDMDEYGVFLNRIKNNIMSYPIVFIMPRLIASDVIDNKNSARERFGISSFISSKTNYICQDDELLVELKYALWVITPFQEERNNYSKVISRIFNEYHNLETAISNGIREERIVHFVLKRDVASELVLDEDTFYRSPTRRLYEVGIDIITENCVILV